MLKHIHKLKQELSEKGWSQKESPEVFQTSFLRSESRMLNWDFNLSESNGVRPQSKLIPFSFLPMKSKPVLKEIQAISFDLDDTLWHTAPVIKKPRPR